MVSYKTKSRRPIKSNFRHDANWPGGIMRQVRMGPLFISVLLALVFSLPQSAQATDTTINFENLQAGTALSNQNEPYSPQGVEFGLTPWGPGGQVVTIMPVAAGIAQSG